MRLLTLKQLIGIALTTLTLLLPGASDALAVQLDWDGQFWFDQNWLNNYQLSRARPGYDADPEFINNGSSYVPGTGEKNTVWYGAFLRLNPKVVVNDSINIKSEFHVGSPSYGFLGRNFPTTEGNERYNFTGSSKDNAVIGAQRFWANLITDFGTIELGRAPRHWGLGAIWNSGDKLFDRFQSTGDMVRLTSKFGNFSIQPALIKVAGGSNVSGATVNGQVVQGNDDVTDYELAVKYDNSEEDFEVGMMWTKRNGNTAQRSVYFNKAEAGSTRINFNTFDFYSRKKLGRFTLGGELPLFSGPIGSIDGVNEFDYKTFAVIFEGSYTSDLWDVGLKLGHVPGQPSSQASAVNPNGVSDDKFRAVYLNNNYKLGLLMFHYNIWGLSNNNPESPQTTNNPVGTTSGTNGVDSPYDNNIVNATYIAVNPQIKLDKWTLRSTIVAAWADETFEANKKGHNHQRRRYFDAVNNQSSFMGWETDLGVAFKWDENFVASWDFGVWFPGGYYAFSNKPGASEFDTSFMFASQVKVGITF